MSTPAPKVNYRLVDRTLSVPDLVGGIAFVQGITKRGPVNDPSNIIYSWPQFVQLFGGLMDTSDFPLHCKILLDKGIALRVNSVKKNAVKATVDVPNADSAAPATLFTLESKYPGEEYNDLSVTLSEASDSELGDFDMEISFNSGEYTESYQNLSANETILSTALANSRWVALESMGATIGTLTGTDLIPDFGSLDFASGDDGDTEIDTELVDFSAFDPYEDSIFLSNICDYPADPTTLAVAGEAYASLRKDLRYYHSIDTNEEANVIIAERATYPYSKWISYTSGGWEVMDPETGNRIAISEVSNFIANGVSSLRRNWWSSFSGPSNPVSGVLAPAVNYGGKAKFAELDALNRANINMAINRNGVNMFWGNFSGQRENTYTKFISTNNLIIFMGKSLIPTLETFIEQPLDLPLFKTIYFTVLPFLERLVNGRAVFSFEWLGDQFATSLSELQINNATDVQNGIYKVRLPITRINPLQEFELVIELTQAGVTIE